MIGLILRQNSIVLKLSLVFVKLIITSCLITVQQIRFVRSIYVHRIGIPFNPIILLKAKTYRLNSNILYP